MKKEASIDSVTAIYSIIVNIISMEQVQFSSITSDEFMQFEQKN